MELGRVIIAAALALGLAESAGAQAFKCKAVDGSILISSQPCRAGARTEAVQPGDYVSPEQKREAEQILERQRSRLAEREAVRAAEAQREHETRRKLAEEESLHQTYCLQIAQREPDPQFRAEMIAACNGVSPQRSVIVQPPAYFPAVPPRGLPPPFSICIGSGCKDKHAPHPKPSAVPSPAPAMKPCAQLEAQGRCK